MIIFFDEVINNLVEEQRYTLCPFKLSEQRVVPELQCSYDNIEDQKLEDVEDDGTRPCPPKVLLVVHFDLVCVQVGVYVVEEGADVMQIM